MQTLNPAVESNSTRRYKCVWEAAHNNMSRNKKQSKGRINRKRKRTALVICQNETQFWTTQAQFWQWVRELKVKKVQDNPLTGRFTISFLENDMVKSVRFDPMLRTHYHYPIQDFNLTFDSQLPNIKTGKNSGNC